MKVKAADGYTYYLAQALADKVLGGLAKEAADDQAAVPAYEVRETYVGKDLEYMYYEPLYECVKPVCEKQQN